MRCAVAWTLVAGLLCSHAAGATERQRVGRAYDRASGDLLYVETHREKLAGQRVVAARVVYADPTGRRFAEKSVDFSNTPEMPTFRFENAVTGHLESLEAGAQGREVVFRESRESALQRSFLDAGVRGIVDAGFDRFIEKNWDQLVSEGSLVRPFLVPSRGEFMDFRIRYEDSASPVEAVFILELDSGLLRLLVEPIKATYSRTDRRLVRYTGISNIRNDEGDNLDVSIVFADGVAGGAPTASSHGARGL